MAINRKSGPSDLVAQKRMDKHGRLVTRHVKSGGNDGPSAALSSQAAVNAAVPVPLNIDWDNTPNNKVGRVVATIMNDIDNPDKVWDNLDVLTSLLESKQGPAALGLIRGAEGRIAVAWRKRHGDNLSFLDSTYIRGDEGYVAYSEVNTAYQTAEGHARDRWENCTPEEKRQNMNNYMQMRPALLEARDVPEVKEEPAPTNPSFLQKLKEAREDGDIMAPFAEKFDDIADVISGGVEEIADRHQSDIPKGVDGDTVAWSDMNPFTSKKKKAEAAKTKAAPLSREEASAAADRIVAQSDNFFTRTLDRMMGH